MRTMGICVAPYLLDYLANLWLAGNCVIFVQIIN